MSNEIIRISNIARQHRKANNKPQNICRYCKKWDMLCEEVEYKKPCALIAQARFCEGFRQQCLILLDLH